jgi:hypothetical protein
MKEARQKPEATRGLSALEIHRLLLLLLGLIA